MSAIPAADWIPDAKSNGGTVAIQAGWKTRLIAGKTHGGKPSAPKPILANAITALRGAPEWSGVIAFNEFSMVPTLISKAPWGGGAGTPWTDHEDRLTANWLQHQSIFVGVEIAGQPVQTVARDRQFHPVREYLNTLIWDNTKRIDTFLSLYFGAEPNDYTSAVGARWLVSAVARIYTPGCKADCCLIAENRQGSKKSTALKVLGQPWFTDEIAELGSKDAALQTCGVWIIELAELESMTRADIGKVKAFISRTTDRFRPPYGKRLIESPRQCVFAGTVNHSTYLRDETGARRFWPFRASHVRIGDLERDRDQLWAEAVVGFRNGATWWLDTPKLIEHAEQEQKDRYEADAWDPLIIEWANRRIDEGNDSVSVGEVLEYCLQKEKANWTKADTMRVGRCLTAEKWERYRDRQRNMEWRYRPPVPT